MAEKLRIKIGGIEVTAELNDSSTAGAIYRALPIKGQANLWGDEIYFAIPLKLDLENGQELVNVGDLGYWPSGQAFCIFFGPTPVSRGSEVRPASAVTVFGKVIGDSTLLKKVASGVEIIVEREKGGLLSPPPDSE